MNRCWYSGTGDISVLVIKTPNYRRSVGRDLQRSLVQLSAPSRTNHRVRSHCSRPCPGNFGRSSKMEMPPPRWALPHSTNILLVKSFTHVQLHFPSVQTVLANSHPFFAGHSWWESGCSCYASPPWRTVVRCLLSLHIPRLKTTHSCQPLLHDMSLQFLLCFSCLNSLYLFPATLQSWKLSHHVSINSTAFLLSLNCFIGFRCQSTSTHSRANIHRRSLCLGDRILNRHSTANHYHRGTNMAKRHRRRLH